MTNRNARRLAAVPAAVVAALFAVTPVLAATSWTVEPGGPVSMTSGTFILKDTKTGAAIKCPSVPVRGTFKTGSGLPGAGIGSITSVDFTACGRGLPQPPAMTAKGLPWHVNVTSYNAKTGVVTGTVSHIQIKLTRRPSDPCSAVVDGTGAAATDGAVKFTYANGTGELKALTTGGNLHFYHVRMCVGLINKGDPATISVALTVSPAQVITSP